MERILRTTLSVVLGVPLVGALAYASVAYALSAPQPLTPANTSVLSSDQFTSLSWTAAGGGSLPVQYFYEVSGTSTVSSTDGSFASPIFRSGPIASTTTGVSGVAPGTYYWHVRAQDATGTTSPWGMINSLTIINQSSSTTSPTSTSTISGTVFNDANGNRQLDAGEHGIPNAEVVLLGRDMNPMRTTTDSNGNYSFSNLPAGSYVALARLQSGDVPTVWPRVIRLDGSTSTTNQNFGERATGNDQHGVPSGRSCDQGGFNHDMPQGMDGMSPRTGMGGTMNNGIDGTQNYGTNGMMNNGIGSAPNYSMGGMMQGMQGMSGMMR